MNLATTYESPRDSPLPISVCTLCKNEAANLPRCLDQITAFAEWIIYDTGSSDRSVEIAHSLGATVITGPWQGFAKSRRTHFNLASQPWIFWIDADEVITPQLVSELREIFSENPAHHAYEINRLMRFEGRWIRHGDWFPDRVTRLFRADSWAVPDREIHEAVRIHGTTGRLTSLVPHHSYRDWPDRRARVENYTNLWAAQHTSRPSAATPSLRATWKFLRCYLLKLGILDGLLGYHIACSIANETFLKYHKLRKKSLRAAP